MEHIGRTPGPNAWLVFQFPYFNVIGKGTMENMNGVLGGCQKDDVFQPSSCDLHLPRLFHRAGYVTAIVTEQCPGKDHAWFDHVIDLSAMWLLRVHTCFPGSNPLRWCDSNQVDGTDSEFWHVSEKPEQHCTGGIPLHDQQFDYFEQFHQNYADLPTFSHGMLLRNHEPSQSGMHQMDVRLQHFLQSMESSNSFVALLGDHGLNYATYAQTQHGRFEANNPALFLLVPQPLLSAGAAWHLFENQRQVVTPLDLHATLFELLRLDLLQRNLHAGELKDWLHHEELISTAPLGMPLFSPMPKYRTCTEARVPLNWCLPSLRMDTSAFVKERSSLLLEAVIGYVNTQISPAHGVCLELNARHFTVSRGVEEPLYPGQTNEHTSQSVVEPLMKASMTLVAETTPDTVPSLVFDAEVLVDTKRLNWTPGDPQTEQLALKDKAWREQVVRVKRVTRISVYGHEPCDPPRSVSKQFCICRNGTNTLPLSAPTDSGPITRVTDYMEGAYTYNS